MQMQAYKTKVEYGEKRRKEVKKKDEDVVGFRKLDNGPEQND